VSIRSQFKDTQTQNQYEYNNNNNNNKPYCGINKYKLTELSPTTNQTL